METIEPQPTGAATRSRVRSSVQRGTSAAPPSTASPKPASTTRSRKKPISTSEIKEVDSKDPTGLAAAYNSQGKDNAAAQKKPQKGRPRKGTAKTTPNAAKDLVSPTNEENPGTNAGSDTLNPDSTALVEHDAQFTGATPAAAALTTSAEDGSEKVTSDPPKNNQEITKSTTQDGLQDLDDGASALTELSENDVETAAESLAPVSPNANGADDHDSSETPNTNTASTIQAAPITSDLYEALELLGVLVSEGKVETNDWADELEELLKDVGEDDRKLWKAYIGAAYAHERSIAMEEDPLPRPKCPPRPPSALPPNTIVEGSTPSSGQASSSPSAPASLTPTDFRNYIAAMSGVTTSALTDAPNGSTTSPSDDVPPVDLLDHEEVNNILALGNKRGPFSNEEKLQIQGLRDAVTELAKTTRRPVRTILQHIGAIVPTYRNGNTWCTYQAWFATKFHDMKMQNEDNPDFDWEYLMQKGYEDFMVNFVRDDMSPTQKKKGKNQARIALAIKMQELARNIPEEARLGSAESRMNAAANDGKLLAQRQSTFKDVFMAFMVFCPHDSRLRAWSCGDTVLEQYIGWQSDKFDALIAGAQAFMVLDPLTREKLISSPPVDVSSDGTLSQSPTFDDASTPAAQPSTSNTPSQQPQIPPNPSHPAPTPANPPNPTPNPPAYTRRDNCMKEVGAHMRDELSNARAESVANYGVVDDKDITRIEWQGWGNLALRLLVRLRGYPCNEPWFPGRRGYDLKKFKNKKALLKTTITSWSQDDVDLLREGSDHADHIALVTDTHGKVLLRVRDCTAYLKKVGRRKDSDDGDYSERNDEGLLLDEETTSGESTTFGEDPDEMAMDSDNGSSEEDVELEADGRDGAKAVGRDGKDGVVGINQRKLNVRTRHVDVNPHLTPNGKSRGAHHANNKVRQQVARHKKASASRRGGTGRLALALMKRKCEDSDAEMAGKKQRTA